MEDMDIARRIELSILAKQEPMNAVIDRGDSPVQLFYKDAVVFLTGGSGFLGKQLIEKLFRSCDIKKIYMLMRPKKGKTIEQRLPYILKDPLYDTLRKKKPKFADKICPVEGDIADIRLGLDDKDWEIITNEVNVIIHMAATVRFDEPLRTAALINVRGTREMVTLAKACKNLKIFNHISTAFAHSNARRIDTVVKEQFYPAPVQPDVFLDLVETVDDEKLNALTPSLIQDWPNTYTFTKAIAEEMIRTTAGDLPVCIVKPPVVTSSFSEPSPGWIDGTVMASPIGYLLGGGLGVMHVLLVNKDNIVTYAPVDYVNNAIIAAGWDTAENLRKTSSDIPLYTISLSRAGVKWRYFGEMLRTDEAERMMTPKVLWHAYLIETDNMFIYWLLTWLLHYIPAYILDGVISLLGVRPKGLPSLVKIYTKAYKLTMVYKYFLWHNWNFTDDNVQAMIKRMSPEDQAIYKCDAGDINFKELVQAFCIGLRRFIVKDNLEGSAQAYKKHKWLKLANYLFLSIYAYLIWKVLYIIYSTLSMLV